MEEKNNKEANYENTQMVIKIEEPALQLENKTGANNKSKNESQINEKNCISAENTPEISNKIKNTLPNGKTSNKSGDNTKN